MSILERLYALHEWIHLSWCAECCVWHIGKLGSRAFCVVQAGHLVRHDHQSEKTLRPLSPDFICKPSNSLNSELDKMIGSQSRSHHLISKALLGCLPGDVEHRAQGRVVRLGPRPPVGAMWCVWVVDRERIRLRCIDIALAPAAISDE